MKPSHDTPTPQSRGVEQIRPPNLLARALLHPSLALKYASSILRGWYYRLKFKLLGRRVIIGRRFRVQGRLDIKGPGLVVFGDDCAILGGRYQTTTPWTHSPEAEIRIGDHVWLSGTRFGCVDRITVGDHTLIGDVHILDTDFHAVDSPDMPRHNTQGSPAPVSIGSHCWLGTGALILKGVTVGENAVVAARAVVSTPVPANTVVAGNPAVIVKELTPRTDEALAASA